MSAVALISQAEPYGQIPMRAKREEDTRTDEERVEEFDPGSARILLANRMRTESTWVTCEQICD